MIRVIALDLDDTLLRSDKTIVPRTLELLDIWQGRGHYVVVATGRPPRTVAESLPGQLHSVPWVCYNGAEIHENGRAIYQELIPAPDTRQIIQLIQTELPGCRVGVEIDNTLYLNQPTDRPGALHVVNLLDVADRPSAKILFSQESFESLAPLLGSLPPSARAMLSDKYNLVQILSRDADKAEALKFLVRRWGLKMENVIAFGDDVNDIDMVQQSGIGVAMENATPQVKAVADRITHSNDDDGVGIVLEELVAGRLQCRL